MNDYHQSDKTFGWTGILTGVTNIILAVTIPPYDFRSVVIFVCGVIGLLCGIFILPKRG